MPINHQGVDSGVRTKAEERQSYLEGYERDLLAGERRLLELEAVNAGDSPAADDARSQIEAAKAQLKRLGGRRQAEQRPQQRKEKRA